MWNWIIMQYLEWNYVWNVYNSDSAPAIRKKTHSKAEQLKRKIGWRLMSTYFSSIVQLLLLFFVWNVRERAAQIAKENTTNLQFIFKSHSDQRACTGRKHMNTDCSAVFTAPAHIVSAFNFYSHAQTNFIFYDQTRCFIRSRACSAHI